MRSSGRAQKSSPRPARSSLRAARSSPRPAGSSLGPARRPAEGAPGSRTLAFALLLVALALPGCERWVCHNSDLRDLSPGIPESLLAVDLGDARRDDYPLGSLLAVGEGGVILTAERDYGPLRITRTGAGSLRAALLGPNGRLYVAGDGGVMLTANLGDESWTPIDTGTDADLHTLAWVDVGDRSLGDARAYQIAVGDEAVLVRDPVDGSWDLIPPPAGGWGRLRAVAADARLHVAGLDGILWSADDPWGPWSRFDSGPGPDLLAGGGDDFGAVLVGAGGTLLHRPAGRWERVETGLGVDLVAVANDLVLAADGRVFDILLLDDIEPLAWTAAGARGLDERDELILVGDHGSVQRIPRYCD
ncbi:MAG: hypothetical protein R3B09_19390 [Nannocystaceae bacterium]